MSVIISLALWAEKTTRSHLKVIPTNDEVEKLCVDTIVPDTAKIILSGYDKPLTSRCESFFVSNKYEQTISSIAIELNYYDASNRQLHSQTKTIECDIPAGETRQVNIQSWDKQLNFYYYLSPKPRRQATPFSVKHRLLSITLVKDSQ